MKRTWKAFIVCQEFTCQAETQEEAERKYNEFMADEGATDDCCAPEPCTCELDTECSHIWDTELREPESSYLVSLSVKADLLEKVLERLADLEAKGLFQIGTVLNEETGEAE